VQLCHNPLGALHTLASVELQVFLKHTVVRIHIVSQNVDIQFINRRAEFNPGDHLDARALGDVSSALDCTHMVVISDAYCRKTCADGECNEIVCRVCAIGKRCVEVEINLPCWTTERTHRDEVKERAMG
jgi:hypothetical protein